MSRRSEGGRPMMTQGKEGYGVFKGDNGGVRSEDRESRVAVLGVSAVVYDR